MRDRVDATLVAPTPETGRPGALWTVQESLTGFHDPGSLRHAELAVDLR